MADLVSDQPFRVVIGSIRYSVLRDGIAKPQRLLQYVNYCYEYKIQNMTSLYAYKNRRVFSKLGLSVLRVFLHY